MLEAEPRRGGSAASPELGGGFQAIDWSRFDFLDIGCSEGGSLRHCKRRFRAGEGLGIDLDAAKIAKVRAQGLEAVQGDVLELGAQGVVRFVSMVQFLEHLPDVTTVERVLAKAVGLATDFVYIHHPSFDDERYLVSKGVRLYYHDWSGHRCHLESRELFAMFERLGLLRYHVRPIRPVYDSRHPAILPLSAPRNQHDYDESRHGPKPLVHFDKPVFLHTEFFVALKPFEDSVWRGIVFGDAGAPP